MAKGFEFTKLQDREDGRFITRPMQFHASNSLNKEDITSVVEFAFELAFGASGEHRNHRSGGTTRRKPGEIFANTFQGKIAEFHFYRSFQDQLDISYPDLSVSPLGVWDSGDFCLGQRKIAIKSTKHFGNLMLLEKYDWDNDGNYVPDKGSVAESYSAFIMIRLSQDIESILKSERLLYAGQADKGQLHKLISRYTWRFDIPGWIGINDLRSVIRSGEFIKKGALLNGRTQMDADNFYIQCGDLRSIKSFVSMLS